MTKHSILIVDDNTNLRVGLKVLFEQSDLVSEVHQASNGREAIQVASRVMPAVVLMDVGMPIMDGVEACQQLKQKWPDLKVIMLTSHDDDRDIFAALAAGANGYCLKDADFGRLEAAVNAVVRGDMWIDSSIAHKVLRVLPKTAAASDPNQVVYEQLSDRELQVLQLIVEGLSNQEIGDRLSIKKDTVKTHIKHIMDKLAVSDRTQAAVKALRHGLV
jgi:NarL family two-component system response regulator LiaR